MNNLHRNIIQLCKLEAQEAENKKITARSFGSEAIQKDNYAYKADFFYSEQLPGCNLYKTQLIKTEQLHNNPHKLISSEKTQAHHKY